MCVPTLDGVIRGRTRRAESNFFRARVILHPDLTCEEIKPNTTWISFPNSQQKMGTDAGRKTSLRRHKYLRNGRFSRDEGNRTLVASRSIHVTDGGRAGEFEELPVILRQFVAILL